MGEGGVIIVFSSHFKRSIKRIDTKLRVKMWNCIRLFQEYPFHATLKTHKLAGRRDGMYAFRVTNDYRIIFRFSDEQVALLEALITHDEYDQD